MNYPSRPERRTTPLIVVLAFLVTVVGVVLYFLDSPAAAAFLIAGPGLLAVDFLLRGTATTRRLRRRAPRHTTSTKHDFYMSHFRKRVY